jgi:hypothetical protein
LEDQKEFFFNHFKVQKFHFHFLMLIQFLSMKVIFLSHNRHIF